MFFDFNVAYKGAYHDLLDDCYPKPGKSIDLPQAVSFGQRAALVTSHVINLPGRIINTIVELVKAILFTLCYGLTFGQSDFIQKRMGFTAFKTIMNGGSIGCSLIGIFAPVNARRWELKLADIMINPEHHTMPTRAFIL